MTPDASTINRLEDRLDELEDELQEERDQRLQLEAENKALRDRLDELEKSYEVTKEAHWELDELLISDLGVMGAEQVLGEHEDLLAYLEDVDDRVSDIEKGQVDPGELAAESGGANFAELLQVHQDYVRVRDNPPSSVDLSSNKERAARVFPHIHEKKTLHEGTVRLYSNDVREILSDKVSNPELEQRLSCADLNPNTVRQTMDKIKASSGGMFEFVRDKGKQNFLEADYEEWTDYWNSVMDEFGGNSAADDPIGQGEDADQDQTRESAQPARADGGADRR